MLLLLRLPPCPLACSITAGGFCLPLAAILAPQLLLLLSHVIVAVACVVDCATAAEAVGAPACEGRSCVCVCMCVCVCVCV